MVWKSSMVILSGIISLLGVACTAIDPRMKPIVFMGDSITHQAEEETGFISILRDSLRQHGIEANLIGAGVDGDKVPDLLERLDADVLQQEPSMVIIFIGINDVWHEAIGIGGTPEDQYESGLRSIVDQIQQIGAKVILCTPTVIGEKNDGSNALDERLDVYAEISRAVASSTGATICDLHQIFRDYLTKHNPENKRLGILTNDEVHLNESGNQLVAAELLGILNE